MGKTVNRTVNRTVKRSEESMTPMTFYGFPHHGDRFFAGALNDALPVFLTTGTDPSRSFRMTFNVPLIMAADPSL